MKYLFNRYSLFLLAFAVFVSFSSETFAKKKKLLVFTKTAGFKHSSIIPGVPAIMKLGKDNGFEVDSTSNAKNFNPDFLKQYAAIVFLSTTGDVLDDTQQGAFEKYIHAGGGYVGVHAATDCEYQWAWYGRLAGGYFISHPAQQVATLKITDGKTIATKGLPETWKRKDEWYNFKSMNKADLNVLITIDETSYNPGKDKMGDHPMAWYHNFEGGRAFYTALGHVDESYSDPLFLNHLLGGIKYAMGTKKMK